jgi:hypothetical protein
MFFMNEFTPDQMDAFKEFYAEHCSAGVGNGDEGFIMKEMSDCGVKDVPSTYKQYKIKRIYQKTKANLFLTSPGNMLLLIMPHGATKDSLPLGLICAPPLNHAKNPRHGREIAATFFEPVTDPGRGDFGIAFKGGGGWDAIEGFLRFYTALVKKWPDSLCKLQMGSDEFGYTTITYETALDPQKCTCLVRTAHTKQYQIMGFDLTFALGDWFDGSQTPFALAYRVNQVVPQRMSLEGMLYVLDTNVFAGLITSEHLEEDAATLEDEFKELDDPATDLSFSQKCKFARPFPKLDKDLDAWDSEKFHAFIKANITHLTPGMSPDTIKPPCVLHNYHQVLRRAMIEKKGPLDNAKFLVPALKTIEAKAFFQARSWWGADFDLIATCKTSKAPRAREMVILLEKNKGGGTLTEVEENQLLDFLKSVQKNWTQKLSSPPKIASASAKTPTPVPETPTSVPETPAPVPETPASVPETPASVPETPAPVLETPASVSETPTPVMETPSPTIENLEIGNDEPIEISRTSLLALKMWVKYFTGKEMAPILLFAYKLEKDEQTIPLIIQALADMEESRKREGDGGDFADEPARKKLKAD